MCLVGASSDDREAIQSKHDKFLQGSNILSCPVSIRIMGNLEFVLCTSCGPSLKERPFPFGKETLFAVDRRLEHCRSEALR